MTTGSLRLSLASFLHTLPLALPPTTTPLLMTHGDARDAHVSKESTPASNPALTNPKSHSARGLLKPLTQFASAF